MSKQKDAAAIEGTGSTAGSVQEAEMTEAYDGLRYAIYEFEKRKSNIEDSTRKCGIAPGIEMY